MSVPLSARMPARRLRTLACCAALFALGLQIGPAPALAAAKRTYGAATPEALVERMNAATAKKDFSEMLACIAPDDRAQLVGALLVGTAMIGAFMQMGGDMAMGMAEGMSEAMSEGGEPTPEQKAEMAKAKKEMEAKAGEWKKKYEATLRKHNLEEMLSEDAPMPAGEGPAALRALLKDTDDIALFEDLLGLLKDSGQGEVKEDAAPPGLPADPIKGLKVQGDRATAQAGDETVEMVKIDGRWYVKVPEKKEGEAPAAPGR